MAPSPSALWLASVPSDSDHQDQLNDLLPVLGKTPGQSGPGKLGYAVFIEYPEFKTGTLSSLLTLSESLAKQDPSITAALQKTVETIRSLVTATSTSGPTLNADRQSPLSSHLVIDDGRPYLEYIFPEDGGKGWEWNRSKYRTESRTLGEVVEALVKEVGSIENAQKHKSASYQLVKGQLTTALRKKTGNLSIRSLAEVVSEEDFAGTNDSEYLETVLVAVPKNLVKEWESSYEKLTSMVVPRSSTKLASDDEFTLFGVAIFRRVKDEFSQKCRENKFIVRDFTYNSEEIDKQAKDLVALEAEEKELWTDLLRLSRINFSELFQILVHIKVVRAYIESVLRYGLPAHYFVTIIKPDPKQSSKLLSALSAHFAPLTPASTKAKKAGKGDDGEAPMGEYATVLEGDYFDFVLFEIEKVDGASQP